MSLQAYHVTVRTDGLVTRYTAIAGCSLDCVLAAFDRFGVCSVSVKVVA